MNPLATVLLGTALVVDAFRLPRGGPFEWGTSTVGTALRGHYYGAGSLRRAFDAVATFSDDNQMRLLWPNIESWDEATRALQENPTRTLTITVNVQELESGFWAPTLESHDASVRFVGGSALTPEQIAEARSRFTHAIGRTYLILRYAWIDLLATRDIRYRRIIWPGVAHSTAAALAAIAFLWSLAWIPATPAWVRGIIAARRTRAGLCASCGYDLVGASSTTCPECGRRRV